jgi:formyltetrahydrofolate deformylase
MLDERNVQSDNYLARWRKNLRLLISCPDKKGLVAAVSSFFERHEGNILRIDQYLKPDPGGRFFMRIEVEEEGFALGRDEFDREFAPLAREYGMDWRASRSERRKRAAILVSKYDHCLVDLLWRWDAGELEAEIPLIISNHPDLASRAEVYGVPYFHLPVSHETKAEQESRVLDLLAEHEIDFVVLARYMQILTPEFIDAYPGGSSTFTTSSSRRSSVRTLITAPMRGE